MQVRSAKLSRWLSLTHGLGVWSRYSFATLLALVALVAALAPIMHGYPFLAFFPVVILSGFWLGRGSGIYATLLSALLVAYYLQPPHSVLAVAQPRDFMGLLVFIAVGVLTVTLIDYLYAAYEELAAGDQQLRAMADQQAMLLKELTHRVRNDLACLASLLSIQSRAAQDAEVRSALTGASDRVRVLGRVYQRLSMDHGEAVVDTRTFITDLCDDLRLTLVGLRPVALNVSVESHLVGIKQAIAVGLIINELVTNALKHAFTDDETGEIKVQFARQEGAFLLRVRDDGRGPPPPEHDSGLGLSLVRAMSVQLGGQLERRDAQPGSLYLVTLPAIPAPS